MLLKKQELKYKSFLKAEKRLNKVRELLRNLPLRELKEPYKKGWIIVTKLREDISRRKDAHIIQEVLENLYNIETTTRSLSAIKAIRKGVFEVPYTDYKGRRSMISLFSKHNYISKEKYENLSEQAKKYFTLDTSNELYVLHGFKRYYGYLPSYYLILKAKPNIITHERLRGGELEKEEKELEVFLDEYWRTEFNYSKQYPRHKDRTNTRALIQKFKKGEIEDIPFNKIPLEYKY